MEDRWAARLAPGLQPLGRETEPELACRPAGRDVGGQPQSRRRARGRSGDQLGVASRRQAPVVHPQIRHQPAGLVGALEAALGKEGQAGHSAAGFQGAGEEIPTFHARMLVRHEGGEAHRAVDVEVLCDGLVAQPQPAGWHHQAGVVQVERLSEHEGEAS